MSPSVQQRPSSYRFAIDATAAAFVGLDRRCTHITRVRVPAVPWHFMQTHPRAIIMSGHYRHLARQRTLRSQKKDPAQHHHSTEKQAIGTKTSACGLLIFSSFWLHFFFALLRATYLVDVVIIIIINMGPKPFSSRFHSCAHKAVARKKYDRRFPETKTVQALF